MSAWFKRPNRQDGRGSAAAVASLLADLENNVAGPQAVSHRDFRDYIRDRGRAQDEAWVPIRAAARQHGHR
jgi:hypothetical protein